MSACYTPYKNSSNNIKVKLDLTKYATKTDLNNITHVDVSSFASKTNLAAALDRAGFEHKFKPKWKSARPRFLPG